MDALTAANALATIVQLIGLYRQEHSAQKDLSHRDFYEWLVQHQFRDIKDLIEHTYHLNSEVDTLLREDHKQILAKLDNVNSTLVDILSRMDGFRQVATAVSPQGGLSEQARWLFQLAAESETGEVENPGRGSQLIIGARIYEAPEPRFLRDDLQALVSRRFFEQGASSSRGRWFRLTRAGYEAYKLSCAGKFPHRLDISIERQ